MTFQGNIARILLVAGILAFPSLSSAAYSTVAGDTSCTAEQANTQETYFHDHPQDTERAACLLDYYARLVPRPELQAPRMWLIRWVIENHPEIRLDGHLEQGLSVSTADAITYSAIRKLWLSKVSQFPNDPSVLLNAANALALTDREAARGWLKRARELNPSDQTIPRYLGNLYAAAIVGISETSPDLVPTSINLSEAQSAFAKQAYKEAGRDAILAAWTGMRLHYWTNYLRYKKICQQDYDFLAESLLQKAADLDFPNPTTIAALRDFYRDQKLKPSGRIEPKVAVVQESEREVSRRLIDSTSMFLQASVNNRPATPVKVGIVIGTDGHVWTANAESPTSGPVALMAQSKADSLVFLPLRLNGRPVQIRTTVTVMVDDLESQPTHNGSRNDNGPVVLVTAPGAAAPSAPR